MKQSFTVFKQGDLRSFQGQKGKIEAEQDAEVKTLRKQLEEKQRTIDDMEKKLKKRTEKLTQLEQQLKQVIIISQPSLYLRENVYGIFLCTIIC